MTPPLLPESTTRELVQVPAFEDWSHALQHWIACAQLRSRFQPWRTPQQCWELALRDALLQPATASKPNLYGFTSLSPIQLLYPFAEAKAIAWDRAGRPLGLDFLINYCNTPAESPSRPSPLGP